MYAIFRIFSPLYLAVRQPFLTRNRSRYIAVFLATSHQTPFTKTVILPCRTRELLLLPLPRSVSLFLLLCHFRIRTNVPSTAVHRLASVPVLLFASPNWEHVNRHLSLLYVLINTLTIRMYIYIYIYIYIYTVYVAASSCRNLQSGHVRKKIVHELQQITRIKV